MSKFVLPFLLALIIGVVLVFGLHLFFLSLNNLPLFGDKILLSYEVNTALAIAIFLFLYKFRLKYKEELGFLYMLGSFFKFILFFTLFYPSFHEDKTVSRQEFLSFFIPYVTCLLIETYFLIKLLNSKELNK